MVKVTLNKDLVPYTQRVPERPNFAPAYDLTHNYLLACNLIQVVRMLFQIRRETAVFSGYIYSRPDAEFKIRIHHKGKQIQCVTLNHLGYGGVLRVEILTQKLESAVHFDLLTRLKNPMVLDKPVAISAE